MTPQKLPEYVRHIPHAWPFDSKAFHVFKRMFKRDEVKARDDARAKDGIARNFHGRALETTAMQDEPS